MKMFLFMGAPSGIGAQTVRIKSNVTGTFAPVQMELFIQFSI